MSVELILWKEGNAMQRSLAQMVLTRTDQNMFQLECPGLKLTRITAEVRLRHRLGLCIKIMVSIHFGTS